MKVTAETIKKVRQLCIDGFSQQRIAKTTGLHQSTVSRIISGETPYGYKWKS